MFVCSSVCRDNNEMCTYEDAIKIQASLVSRQLYFLFSVERVGGFVTTGVDVEGVIKVVPSVSLLFDCLVGNTIPVRTVRSDF